GAGLTALREKYARHGSRLDVLLVTHPNCLDEPEMLKALAELPQGVCHVATVDREGQFALQVRTPGGWSPLAVARLKWETPFSGKAKPLDKRAGNARPAFLYEPLAPLLLPVRANFRAIVERPAAPHYAGFTERGDLWAWESGNQGARRLP